MGWAFAPFGCVIAASVFDRRRGHADDGPAGVHVGNQSSQSFTRASMSGGSERPSFASAERLALKVNWVAPARQVGRVCAAQDLVHYFAAP